MFFKNICISVIIIITPLLLLSCGMNNDTNSSTHSLNLSQTDRSFIVNEAVPSFLQFFETSLATYNTELVKLTNSTDPTFNKQSGWIKMECKGAGAESYCADFILVYNKEDYGRDYHLKPLELSEVLKLSSLANHRVELSKNDIIYPINLTQSTERNGLLKLSVLKGKYNFTYTKNELKLIFNINSEFFQDNALEFNCIQTTSVYNCAVVSFDDNHKDIMIFYVDESKNTSMGKVNYSTQSISLNGSDGISIPPKKYIANSEVYTHHWVDEDYYHKDLYTVQYNNEFKPIRVIIENIYGETRTSEIDYITDTIKLKTSDYSGTHEYVCNIDFQYDHLFLKNILSNYCEYE